MKTFAICLVLLLPGPVLYAANDQACRIPAGTRDTKAGDSYERLLKTGRLIPNSTGKNKMNGFKIIGIIKGSLYDLVGLENKDIITHIGKKPIDQPELGFSILETLSNASPIQFSVIRGTEKIKLSCAITQPEWPNVLTPSVDSKHYVFDMGKDKTKPPEKLTAFYFKSPEETTASVATFKKSESYCQDFCGGENKECGKKALYAPRAGKGNPIFGLLGSHSEWTFERAEISGRTDLDKATFETLKQKYNWLLSAKGMQKSCSVFKFDKFEITQCGKMLGILKVDESEILASTAEYGTGLVKPLGTITKDDQVGYLFLIGYKGRTATTLFIKTLMAIGRQITTKSISPFLVSKQYHQPIDPRFSF